MENNTTDILNKFDQFLASRNLSRDSEAASIRNQLKLMIQELQIVKNPCRRREKRSLCIVDRKCPACRCDPDSKGIIMANDGGSNVCSICKTVFHHCVNGIKIGSPGPMFCEQCNPNRSR